MNMTSLRIQKGLHGQTRLLKMNVFTLPTVSHELFECRFPVPPRCEVGPSTHAVRLPLRHAVRFLNLILENLAQTGYLSPTQNCPLRANPLLQHALLARTWGPCSKNS